MRLINIKDDAIFYSVDFFEPDVPEYALLSHTWGSQEVTYQDWAYPATCATKSGYSKIVRFADFCRSEQIVYIWVDTCKDASPSQGIKQVVLALTAPRLHR